VAATNQDHLRARRRAQAIAKICRHVRRLHQQDRMTKADVEVRAFRCGDVLVVSNGLWHQWTELRDAAERLWGSNV